MSTLSGATVMDDRDDADTGVGEHSDPFDSHRDSWGALMLEPGKRLGPYELDRLLGSGGMGEVYSARHVDSGKLLAIKFLSRTTPRLLYRFKREFRSLSGVAHRNIISLGELVVPPTGTAFFTMELVDGLPFVDYVRRQAGPGELPNLIRLGRALRQLVAGLGVLHELGRVHRDLKPSNVLVTREGRVVILDFGLVSELGNDDDSGISRDGQLLGTPAYMAPEQAALREASVAVDFYAVGVMLFECLTGVLPYRGSAMEIILRKQDDEPPDPSDLVSGIPPALRDLCMALLAPEPERRPQREELLSVLSRRELGGEDPSAPGESSRRERPTRAPFVGRRTELRALSEALDDVKASGAAVTVLLGGESGLGKTALVHRFLAHVRATSDAMLLRGRCFERESVPYKGVDSIVDSLSARLRRMLDDDLAALRPAHVGQLVKIFPVLSDLWAVTDAGSQRYEPSELRRLGTAALREILSKLAAERPLVLAIDDFQWSDVDGARLLNALVRPPEPPPLLLVIGFRGALPEVTERSEAMRELCAAEVRLGRDIRELQLGPLSDAAATELAAALLGLGEDGTIVERATNRRRADAIARRAKGNPFFIGQMVIEHDDAEEGELVDDRLVARRIVGLEPGSRRVLATISAAGGPTPIAVVREICGEPSAGASELDEIGAIIEELVGLGLLTRRGFDHDSSHDGERPQHASASGSASAISTESMSGVGGPVVEPAHGRIRDVTIAELETGELEEIHRRLGHALERRGGDPDTLAVHFERAGEPERALAYVERAAEQAISALAFGRAVARYRRALELLDRLAHEGRRVDAGHRRALQLALAEQLTNFGRSSEAGRLLRELAASEADPRRALALRREAAEQLLEAGHVGEGLALSAEILREVNEAPPRGFWLSVLKFVWGRVRIGLRGLGYRERRASELAGERLELFDTLMLINRGLSLHLEMHSFVLHNRLLQLALELGEPRRLAMTLAYEILIVASFGGESKVHAIASEARDLAARVNSPEIDRLIDLQRPFVDYAQNRFRIATDRLAELLPQLDAVAGAEWLRLMAVLVYSSLCVITGRWADLYRELPQWLAAARERGNVREIVELEAYAAMTELHRDNREQARYHLQTGRELWDASSYNYTSVMLDRVEIFLLLSEREHDRVRERVEALLAAVKRSSVAINPVVQRFVDQTVGRCWAAAAVRTPDDHKLQAQLRKVCKRLRRSKVPLYIGEAALFEAALSSIVGDADGARRRWREAELLFEQSGIECQLAAVRWRLARMTSGAESRGFSRNASKYFAANGIGDPDHIAEVLVPAADARALVT